MRLDEVGSVLAAEAGDDIEMSLTHLGTISFAIVGDDPAPMTGIPMRGVAHRFPPPITRWAIRIGSTP